MSLILLVPTSIKIHGLFPQPTMSSTTLMVAIPKSCLWLLLLLSALTAEALSDGIQDLSPVQYRKEKWALERSSSSQRLFRRANRSPGKSSSGSLPRPTSPQPVQEAQTTSLPPQTGKSPSHSPQRSPGPAPIRPSVVRWSSGSVAPPDKAGSSPKGVPPILAGDLSHPLNQHRSGSAAKDFGAFKPVTPGHGGTDSKFTNNNRHGLRERNPKRKPSYVESDDEDTAKGVARKLPEPSSKQPAGQSRQPPKAVGHRAQPTDEQREEKRLDQLERRRRLMAETGSRRKDSEREKDNLRNRKKAAERKDPWESEDLQESYRAATEQEATSRQQAMKQWRAEQREGKKGNTRNAWDVPENSPSPSNSGRG